MHHFDYRGGELHAEDVNLTSLAQTVGTPFYCYSTATIERHYRVFAEAFADVDALVCYSVKANSNQAVIATLGRLGAGADIVSEGELLRALAAGIPPQKIMFSGVGKTPRNWRLRSNTAFSASSRVGSRDRATCRDRRRERSHRRHLDPRRSGHRRQDPRQDRDRQGGK